MKKKYIKPKIESEEILEAGLAPACRRPVKLPKICQQPNPPRFCQLLVMAQRKKGSRKDGCRARKT